MRPDHPTLGWLPIGLEFDPHTAILGEGLVRWMEVGDEPLADPFFQNTVQRLRTQQPPPREIGTTLDALLALAAGLAPVTPAGFILHVSRCGSTLVTNALRAAPGVVAASEPPHVMQCLLPGLLTGGAYATARWQHTRKAVVDALFTLLAHYRTGRPEQLVVKHPSLTTLSMPLLRALWPGVPCLIVIREPVEVLVANLSGGLWLDLHRDPARADALLGWNGRRMALPEFCARALGQYQTAALGALDDNCRVIDYADLTPAAIPGIARFFGLPEPPAAGVTAAFGTYSKGTDGSTFRDDRSRKQQGADYDVRVAALRWATPSYTALRVT